MQIRPLTLNEVIGTVAERKTFRGDTPQHLAGRCLLDALEFLRIDPKWPARFGVLTNAHAIRLCWQCVKELDHEGVRERIRKSIDTTYRHLLESRKDAVPFYGDDLWDCAYILEAMLTVIENVGNDERKATLASDLRTYYREVKVRLDKGLALGEPGEWFGPALATAAHRLLSRDTSYIDGQTDRDATLARLKGLALEPIRHGRYLKRKVAPEYYHWHLGQVVAEFPKESRAQRKELLKLRDVSKLTEKAARAYALARVLQGAVAIGDSDLCRRALSRLYGCQELSRPLGTGLVGDTVKASLNTLEGIWKSLKDGDRKEVSRMLDALLAAQRRANRIGILVAIDLERKACVEQFKSDGAKVSKSDGEAIDEGVVELDHPAHPDYQVLIVTGKSLLGATDAATRLIKGHEVVTAILVGIAGSLGQRTATGEFRGPRKGDVVISTSAAAYRIREKAREATIDAPVPWGDTTWAVLPSDPSLFSLAHRVAQTLSPSISVHEGMIVTGNGIKDNRGEKERVREKWPGGLAVAEEGFVLALECMEDGVPQLEIRGISDQAEGDKAEQQHDPGDEARDQELAARNAARVAVALVRSLSESW